MFRPQSSHLHLLLILIVVDHTTAYNIKRETSLEAINICDAGEIYYGDGVCDCRPKYIYHPKTERCHPAYDTGPCSQDEYLIFNNIINASVCERKSCRGFKGISFEGECRSLGEFCGDDGFIEIDRDSLEIGCLPRRKSKRSSGKVCFKGSRRYFQGKCPEQQKVDGLPKEVGANVTKVTI